ncbi:CsgE family curli-type amyloid fiber assembly protein [Algoriphagus confluentis]|uniref:CsgE family curli-type amyloid fiber assembly protein n=1 Tax=Algoriphagus confluentis TaxID=1697556 RepID=UPI0030C6651F
MVFIIFIGFVNLSFAQSQSTNQSTQGDTTRTVRSDTPDFLKTLVEEVKSQVSSKKSSDVVLEIDGLLIDDTKTKGGRDFYDLFFRDWVAPPQAKNYSIFIVEKPFRLNQTTIEISINEILIFQAFLQPRTDYIEELALQSIGITQQYLVQYEQLVRELDGEERRGTGIF